MIMEMGAAVAAVITMAEEDQTLFRCNAILIKSKERIQI